MNFLTAVANMFRSAPKDQQTEKVDRYGILTPLLMTGELVSATADMCKVITIPSTTAVNLTEALKGKTKSIDLHAQKSVQSYQNYVSGLSSHEQQLEKAQPLSSLPVALENIRVNLLTIEDNFQSLFSGLDSEHPEQNIKSSSLVIIGYLQKTDKFCTWIAGLIEHMTSDAGDLIPPFRTREMVAGANDAAAFVTLNMTKWNPKRGGLLSEVKTMQSKGVDLPLQTASGQWIDEFAHDSQFSPDEKDLMVASLRNPMLILINWGHVRTQAHIELLSARKEWLTSKIIELQSKSRGADVTSPEYLRMKKATDKYASIISKYEQQIERMRG